MLTLPLVLLASTTATAKPPWKRVDTTPPETTITSGPSGDTTQTTAAFGVSSSESGSSFECKLDAASFAGCSSPKSYSGVAAGSHTFSVRAIDAARNVDATPASRNFDVVAAKTASPPPPPSDGCGWGSFSATNQPGACWRPYSDTSPFNRGVTSLPTVVSNSSSIVTRTTNFGAAGSRGGPWFRGGIADTDSDYDHPLYYSQPDDPAYTVHCRQWVSSCSVEGMQVRIPAEARPAGGTDAHLDVIDQDAGWEYGLWETESRSPSGGTLYIGYGGRTRIGTSDADGLGSSSIPNGVTAAHFGLAAGVVRPEELAAGHIDHALFMAVKCTNGTYVWPARGPGVGRSCSSMGLSNADAPALGQHFYLDLSSSEIDGLAIPAWKKTILHAMADYGMFVGDTGSDYLGWSIFVQSGSSYTSFGQTDPWVTLAKQYGIPSSSGTYYFDLKDTVSWATKLRVADPCVSHGTC